MTFPVIRIVSDAMLATACGAGQNSVSACDQGPDRDYSCEEINLMLRRFMLAAVAAGSLALQVCVAQTITEPSEAGPYFAVQGEYQGELKAPDQPEMLKVARRLSRWGTTSFTACFISADCPATVGSPALRSLKPTA